MRSKLIGILIAIVLTSLLGWGFWKFAPVPKNTSKKIKPDSNLPTRQNNSNGDVSARSDKPDLQYSLLMGLLGESVGKGSSNVSLETYCLELESRYRQRGFRNYQEAADSIKNNRRPESGKIYWSNCENPVAVINAVGDDANLLSTEKDAAVSQYTTIIEKKNDAVLWETFRLGDRQKDFENGADFPGEDPPIIPRISDSQRLFGLNQSGKYTVIYQTGKDIRETLDWYIAEFAKIQFEKTEVPSDKGNLIFFTKDKYFCTLWLSKSEVDEKTTIFITLQN